MTTAEATTGITSIAEVLANLGIELTRSGGAEIVGRCPVHIKRVGKADNSPSWSMNAETGLWICFSCGAKGTLSSLIAELTGSFEDTMTAHRLLMESGMRQLTSPERVEYKPDVDWLAYNKFENVPEKVSARRNLDPDVVRSYGVKWNGEKKALVIPIVSAEGELLGWQEKGNGWFNNVPVGVKKSVTLFGIERFHSKTAVLVESPLDVVRFASSFSGMQALATFGAFVSKEQLRLIPEVADRVIIAMDNDKAGISSAKALLKHMPRLKGGMFWLDYSKAPDAKDIGEMTDEQIYKSVVGASIIPWWLQ
jgi:5S rRNA maturation endonuclease (ribonuclease M5)